MDWHQIFIIQLPTNLVGSSASSSPLSVASLPQRCKQHLFDLLLSRLSSLSRLFIMPSSKFTVAPEHFGDPDGISGLAMAEKAGVRHADPPDDSSIIIIIIHID